MKPAGWTRSGLKITDLMTPAPDIITLINALPQRLRDYIHHLETDCDPQGTIRENFRLREENKGLRAECERLAAGD